MFSLLSIVEELCVAPEVEGKKNGSFNSALLSPSPSLSRAGSRWLLTPVVLQIIFWPRQVVAGPIKLSQHLVQSENFCNTTSYDTFVVEEFAPKYLDGSTATRERLVFIALALHKKSVEGTRR